MGWGIRASGPCPSPGLRGPKTLWRVFNAAYRIDSTYRTAHHGADVANPAGFGGVAEIIPAPTDSGKASVIHDQDGVKITVIGVDHAPV